MALARRSLFSQLRRLHPSVSHLLPHHRDDASAAPSPPVHPTHSPNLGGRRVFGSVLPLGAELAVRRYSSGSGGPHETEYLNDVTNVFAEKGVDVAEVLMDKGTEAAQPAVSEVAAAAADSAFPVAALQHIIDAVHSFTGLNWWAAIALTTVMIRSATVPLLVHQLKATSKLSLMRPELEALKEQMQNSEDPNAFQENQRRIKELFKKHGVTPFTPLKGIFIQGPIFISFYLAITNMVQKFPSFKDGGAFWFTDLTTPDPFYALPILTGSAFLLTVELNMQEGLEGNPVAGTMKKFSRFFAFLSVPITASFPKAIFCYWITSNLFSLTYGLAIKRPQVRRFLNLPEIPVQSTATSQISSPFFEGKNQSAAADTTSPADHSRYSERRAPSSAVISQRLRNLERTVKARNKQKKSSR